MKHENRTIEERIRAVVLNARENGVLLTSVSVSYSDFEELYCSLGGGGLLNSDPPESAVFVEVGAGGVVVLPSLDIHAATK